MKREGENVRSLLLAGVAVFVSDMAHADDFVPFFPKSQVPDYVASMESHEKWGKPERTSSVAMNHEGWTRVERNRGSEINITYGNFFKHLELDIAQKISGEITRFYITQVEPEHDNLGIKGVKETNDRETVSGVRCRWTEIVRENPRDKMFGLFWSSCLTDDGIEIANKVLGSDREPISETRLIELKRIPVRESNVLPPKLLFDPAFWFKPLRDYPHPMPDMVDFEAKMVSRDAEVKLLRHYPWWFRERRDKDGSINVKIWNSLENQGIDYSSSKGKRQLGAGRMLLDPKRPIKLFDMTFEKVATARKGQYLGEDCIWFDLMPNVADAGELQCQTTDGIPLKDVYTSGLGPGESFETISFTRRPISMKELLPAKEIFDPAGWGFLVVK